MSEWLGWYLHYAVPTFYFEGIFWSGVVLVSLSLICCIIYFTVEDGWHEVEEVVGVFVLSVLTSGILALMWPVLLPVCVLMLGASVGLLAAAAGWAFARAVLRGRAAAAAEAKALTQREEARKDLTVASEVVQAMSVLLREEWNDDIRHGYELQMEDALQKQQRALKSLGG